MTLKAFMVTVQVGQPVQVPVWLYNNTGLADIGFTATFNPAVAVSAGPQSTSGPQDSALTALRGYVLDGTWLDLGFKQSGLVNVGITNPSGVSGSGPVVYLPFRATGKVGDKTPVTLAVSKITATGGGSPAIDLINGEIDIVGPDGLVQGSCSGDVELTSADAWCALEMAVGNKPPQPNMVMDGRPYNGVITPHDATLILERVGAVDQWVTAWPSRRLKAGR